MSNLSTVKHGGPLSHGQPPAILQHEIVEILLDAERIQLNQFLSSTDDADETMPVSACVSVRDLDTPASAQAAVDRARERAVRRRRMGMTALGCGLVLLAAVASFLVGQQVQPAAAASSWRVLQVNPDGVVVKVGSSQVPVIVGGILPDGQRLLSVDAQRQIYSTPLQDVRVRPQVNSDAMAGVPAQATPATAAPATQGGQIE